MKLSKQYLPAAALAAGVLLGIPAAWAESQVSDPGAFGILIDPNASGTKLSGFVTLSYDYDPGIGFAQCPITGRFIRNLYAVATLQKGNQITPFNANYTTAAIGVNNLPACFEVDANQVLFLKLFIEKVILPGLYGCVPGGCPQYAVKSVKNFFTTGVGAGSMEVELAVK